jgi:transcriptional regulator with XRE-family HTH domain
MCAGTINQQLGDFLRQRREGLTPADVGLRRSGRRRTPGLRREEVAERAGISVDWYVRLEQGRDAIPSKATVEALAKALLLQPSDRQHLLKLARGEPARVFKRESVPPELARLVQLLTAPAYLLGARFDMLCWNQAAVEIFRDFSKIPEGKRNTVYQMFAAPELRKSYPNWAAPDPPACGVCAD